LDLVNHLAGYLLFGLIKWIIPVAIYIVMGIVGAIFTIKFRTKYNQHKKYLRYGIASYIIVGIMFVLSIIPGSLSFFYTSCVPNGLTGWVDAKNVMGDDNLETLQQRVIELGGHCAGNTLVQWDGKPIFLFYLTGCWGNPPNDYDLILQKQADEITKLKEQYTVLEILCDDPIGPLRT
jgi:hypothetical protein